MDGMLMSMSSSTSATAATPTMTSMLMSMASSSATATNNMDMAATATATSSAAAMGGMGGMGGMGSANACKISMLWNWYTINTCFIARSWKNDTRGKFAGSCIGCFLLVLIAQWLNRISRQLDVELVKRHSQVQWAKYIVEKQEFTDGSSSQKSDEKEIHTGKATELSNESSFMTLIVALGKTLSHYWFLNFIGNGDLREDSDDLFLKTKKQCNSGTTNAQTNAVFPSLLDHIARSFLFLVQWGLSYIIMLLFMYYNGYIIISCGLGALFGRLIFNYEPLATFNSSSIDGNLAHDKESNDRKCCF
ncbi:high-affinity Cu transporter CTR3 NDAI_0J02430 [Naumovozyma dairenensis CBS 421]|uniref:Copper transport protein n=1 Tax=Naumovozyma dairenensis (strain ATCC 10597 / BCRC 20456 / CBS 421 / NBRC 0211 / NRRL Y-12639) TaxID=1071378 RepID=G0WH57_NAUDC|nr:hypothetical protein NDAI_0J02430 [Naumovozyma dairenensis CBS 421]CCD27135.1 hypothetical protein NDAI_0J02430 [Naumovozyma dairenensis CBS 421]